MQSIALPDPFSLEMASSADGVTFLVRCHDDSVVWHQLAAHYPQAHIETIAAEDDPALLRENENAWSIDLKVDGANYLPIRTFRDDDLLDQGSDPMLAIIGALSDLRAGERVLSRLVLHSLGPNWSQAYQEKGYERPDVPQNREEATGQQKPSPGPIFGLLAAAAGLFLALRGYTWYQQGQVLPAVLLAAGTFGMACLGAWVWSRFRRPGQDIHDPIPIREKVSRVAFNVRLEVTAFVHNSIPERAETLLNGVAAAYHHYDNPAGARLHAGATRPGVPATLALQSNGLFHGISVLGVREVASLWHPPGGQDETPFVERSGAKMLRPPPKDVREGALVGKTTTGMPQDVHFAKDTLRRHHLYVARTRMGKSTLMQHIVTHLFHEKAMGLNNDAIVVVDPHADLIEALLEQVPPELASEVKLIDLGDNTRSPGINLLDNQIFSDRDRTTDSVVRIARGLWDQIWGPRMQSILEHVTKTLLEANAHPATEVKAQYTLLDGLRLLTDAVFRNQVLARCSDPYLLQWWSQTFGGWRPQQRAEAIAPVQTRLAYYSSSKKARAILGQSNSTLDIRQVIKTGGVLLVSTAQGTAGRDVSALVGASILNLTDAIIREQGQLPRNERRGVLVVVDEMQAMPGVDYEAMLSELGKFGANFILATQSLAKLSDLSDTMQVTLLANVGCLVVFQVAAADARALVGELGREHITEEDITSLPVHHCYVRSTVGLERVPTYSMQVLPPPPGNPAVAALIRSGVHAYTTSAEELAANQTRDRELVEKYRQALSETQPHGPGHPEDTLTNAGKPTNQNRRRNQRSRRREQQTPAGFPKATEIPPEAPATVTGGNV